MPSQRRNSLQHAMGWASWLRAPHALTGAFVLLLSFHGAAQDFVVPEGASFVPIGSSTAAALEHAEDVLSALDNSIIDTTSQGGNLMLSGTIEGVDFDVFLHTFASDYGTDGFVYGVTSVVYDPPPPTATDIYFRADAQQMANPARLIQTMYHEILHIWLASGFPELSESEDPDCIACAHVIINMKTAEDLCASANCCATPGCETSDPPLTDSERQELVDAAEHARQDCESQNASNPCGSSGGCDAPKPTTQPHCPPMCEKKPCQQ